MPNNHTDERLFDRFMRWAEGAPSAPEWEAEEDPERQEFLEYLEYLDAHEHIDFETYRLKRDREREARGLPPEHPHHHLVVHEGESVPHPRPGTKKRRRRLRSAVRLYRGLSIGVVCVLAAALLLIALELPAFGDPDAPVVNDVTERYLEQGVEETGAVNAVAGMILDYRAFDTFGESTVLFAATMSVILLLRTPGRRGRTKEYGDRILTELGRLILPAVMLYGIYVVFNGHLSPGGGFSGGTVLGCGLILGALVLGQERMEELLPPRTITALTVGCLLAYGVMKGYSFFTGANHVGWEVPKGEPGAIFSAGFILPLNICVGVIVACTMYTFYTLFSEGEE